MVQRKTTWSAKTIASTGEAMAAAMLRMREQEKEIGRLRHHVSMLLKKIHMLRKLGDRNGDEGDRRKEEVAREVAPSPEIPVVAELPVTKAERVAQEVPEKEVAEVEVQVAPRKGVAGRVARKAQERRVAVKVAQVAPKQEVEMTRIASKGKRLVSEDEGEGDRGETGWRVITRKNKKRLVERPLPKGSEPGEMVEGTGIRRDGFIFMHVDGCVNDTPEKDDFLRGVLDRVKAKKTHGGVVRMLLQGKGCLNCSFEWRNEGERIWIPGGGD